MAKRIIQFTLASLVILGLFAVVFILGANLYTEYLWFVSFDATVAFWAQFMWQVILWFVGSLVAFLWVWVFGLRPLRKTFKPGYYIGMSVAALLAMVFAGPWLASRWVKFLQFIFYTPYGMTDPVFGREISYYLLSLPFISDALSMFYVILGFTALITILSWLASRLSVSEGEERNHKHVVSLVIQFSLFLLVFAAEKYFVAIPGLVYTQHPSFFGAGWIESNIKFRAYFALALVTTIMALYVLWITLFRPTNIRRILITSGAMAGLWTLAWLLATSTIIPNWAHRVSVQPNEITKQEPYIKHNIAMTREGFGLTQVEEIEFKLEKDWNKIREIIARNPLIIKNTRIWDTRMLIKTINQLQALRQYYMFGDIDVDRYTLGGEYTHVMPTVREIDLQQLNSPDGNAKKGERNWINEHLQYTHGYGMALVPVNRVGSGGLPYLLVKDFPPASEFKEIAIKEPRVYFGEHTNQWVLVNTKLKEIDYPEGPDNVLTQYQGKGGIQLSSYLRWLAFVWKFRSADLLLNGYDTFESRIMFDRSISKIVQKIAPFLTYDNDPYPVITEDGRIIWIIDALTTSNRFPHAQPFNGVNYARNSVKVVIDAYEGKPKFYVFDEKDPLIKSYSKMYPGLFRPSSEMPAGIRKHVRFSEDLLLLMAEAYKTYHMTNPHVFYNKEDVWDTAKQLLGVGEEHKMAPYYIVEKFPGQNRPEIALKLPFTPKNKTNLIGWLAGRVEGDNYGKLISYHFPKQETVFGPRQIESRINQDPEISAKITLWNMPQQGSNVKHGNLLVIPIEGKVLLYLEPIYIESNLSPMPEMQGVVVVINDSIGMAPTFQKALERVLREK